MPEGYAIRTRAKFVEPVGMILLGCVLAGAAFALSLVLERRGLALTVAALVFVAGSVWFAATRRTGLALCLLMLYLGGLDGYLKLATGSSVVTLVRDMLLYAIAAGMLARSQVQGRRLSLPPLSGWVVVYVVAVLVQVANPNGGTVSHSLTGVRPHIEFIPLFFLGYVTVREASSLRRFVLLLLVLAAANGIVGFVQFNLSPAQLAQWGKGYAERINGTGPLAARTFVDSSGISRVRPFGLGSDAGSGGLFGVLAIGGIFAFSSLIFPVRYRIGAAILGAGAVTAIITSQGRGVIVAAVATALAFGTMTATSQRRLATLAGVAVVAAVAYFVGSAIISSAGGGNAFRYQGLSASKILATTSTSGGRPGQLSAIGFAIAHYPLGAGLGIAGPASGAAGGSSLTGTLNAESEFSFLTLEAGVPGLLAVIGFTLMLLGLGLMRIRREPNAETRILLAAIISPIAGMLVDFYAGADTVSVPDGPFLWFVGGLIGYWLITVPRERRRRQRGG
jgi:hypothetical protein